MKPAWGLVPTCSMPLPQVLATWGNAFCEGWQLCTRLPHGVSNLPRLYSREGHCCVCFERSAHRLAVEMTRPTCRKAHTAQVQQRVLWPQPSAREHSGAQPPSPPPRTALIPRTGTTRLSVYSGFTNSPQLVLFPRWQRTVFVLFSLAPTEGDRQDSVPTAAPSPAARRGMASLATAPRYRPLSPPEFPGRRAQVSPRAPPPPSPGRRRPRSPSTVFFLKSEAMLAAGPEPAGTPWASAGSFFLLRWPGSSRAAYSARLLLPKARGGSEPGCDASPPPSPAAAAVAVWGGCCPLQPELSVLTVRGQRASAAPS